MVGHSSGQPTEPAYSGNAWFGPALSIRIVLGGILMGFANLVPGISGGTMVLVMGLYERFVTATANLTRLRFRTSDIAFVVLLGGAASLVIVGLAGVIAEMYDTHRGAMRALFIGLTLGGAPLLGHLCRPMRVRMWVLIGVGIGLIALCSGGASGRTDGTPSDALDAHYLIDFGGGILGSASMVLPGISGSYMLLLIERYGPILGAIEAMKNGDWSALHILVPVGAGALLGLLFVSNALKWLLQNRPRETHAMLLGILLGSVIGLWPFDETSSRGDYATATGLAAGGFLLTFLLAKLTPHTPEKAI